MSRLQHNLFACGQTGLPEVITCNGDQWHHQTTFKHDFFACTGLYVNPCTQQKCVLKLSRIHSFFGFPLSWLGRFLRNREHKIIRQLHDLDQVPKVISPFGRHGLVYDFIEGQSLDEKPAIPDDYFDQLSQLLIEMHKRNVCYMDMNKRGNILGNNGRPYLIDFQISLLLSGKWCGFLRRRFQKEDIYHLLKHKRRCRPDLMEPEEMARSRRISVLIRIHRMIGVPFREIRRSILRVLYKKDILTVDPNGRRSPENDQRRFVK